MGRRTLVALLLATTSITILGAARVVAQPASQSSFDIPAGPLNQALAAFGRQSGTQISYEASIAAGKTSPGVRGAVSREQAIARILQGSGLSFSFTDPTSVLITRPGIAAGGGAAPADGSIVLDAISVTSGTPWQDVPFETAGTSNVITREELERFPAQTAGSIFQGTPGVISGGGNNGASIDPNIRGLQGMNRVATTIDGSQQSSSSYRGYAGADSRTYVDPDLIGGITITKGPDGGVAGAIGGTVAMDTLGVDDILREGEAYGVRLRAGVTSNSTEPVIGQTNPALGSDQTTLSNGSFAAASRSENVDLVGAFVRRKTGNYFAGTEGSLTTEDYLGQRQRLSTYGYGQQVFNTSEDVTSGLLKATLRPAEDHELQLAYLYYGNDYGEVPPSVITAGSSVRQLPLYSVNMNQATARYRYNPSDNDLVDFKANAYVSNLDETTYYYVSSSYNGSLDQQSRNYGVNADNTSRFSLADTPLALNYGVSYTYEQAQPTAAMNVRNTRLWARPAAGEREVGSLFARATWEPVNWLKAAAGAEYISYNTNFLGVLDWGYTGLPYTSYSGDGVSPSASVTITPIEGWQIYGQYSTGIRPQSVREVSQTRSDQRFNPDLQAEEARNWEVGTNLLKDDLFLKGDKAKLKLAYFDNTTDNYIGRQYADGYMTAFNYDYVRFKGFELSGGYDVGWAFADFGFNYYTDYEACQQNGVCLDYTLSSDYLTNQMPPRFTASITAGARFFEERVTIGGRVTYMGERLAQVKEDGAYFAWVTKLWEPYTVVDAFAQWKISDVLTLDVSVQNLLDAYYVDALNNTDMPAPGRTVTATLTGKLGGTEPLRLPTFGSWDKPWTGAYIGAHIGYGFGTIDGVTTPVDGSANAIAATESADQKLGGILGGVQGGFNYQFSNNFVVGIEGDFTLLKMNDYRDAVSTEGPTLIERGMLQARTDYSFDWLATVRGRFGYAFDDLLVYGTGGVAFLKETETRTQYISYDSNQYIGAGDTTIPSFTENKSAVRTGFTVGGGAEYAISDRWSIKADYSFAGFGKESFLFKNARSGVTKTYTKTTQVGTAWVVRSVPLCATRGGIFCDLVERPVYETTTYPGTSETINGRNASNSADFQAIKIGLNYRF